MSRAGRVDNPAMTALTPSRAARAPHGARARTIPHRAIAAWVLAALVTPAAALASITNQARPIVDHYVAATGGRSALDAERSLHTRGRIEANKLQGTVEQWSQAPDQLVMRVSLGTLRVRMGYDGRSGWRTDLSSKRVRRLEGRELEKIASDAYFENEMWAREDQGGGAVTYGNFSMRAGEIFHSLDVKPPIGPARRLWFSEKTGFLTRMTTRVDQRDEEMFYSEFRALGGRKRPTLHDAVNQDYAFLYDDAPVNRVRVDSLWANPAVDSARFASPASDDGALTWLKAAGIARVGFGYSGRHVWIKASFNGAPPADFILDTGASTTAIDRDYARRIGLIQSGEFAIQGMGGSDAASIARVKSVRVTGSDGDGVGVNDLKVTVVDLGDGHEELLWKKMNGLIGYDVLSRFVVEIDYDRHVVTFREPASFAYAGTGSALDMTLMSGVPVVRAQLDHGCAGDFLVDVGNAFGLIVHGSLVKRCGVFGRVSTRKQVKIYGGGIGSGFASWLCRLDTLQLGSFALPEPIAGLSLATHGMVGSEDYSGNIGNGVLERFRCTFDYPHGKLYLEPGARFAQRDRYSRVGAGFLREGGRVIAWGIVHGSAADEAGLHDHDEVVTIDGKPAIRLTPEDLDRLLLDGEIGSTHALVILREGKREKLTITLQDVI